MCVIAFVTAVFVYALATGADTDNQVHATSHVDGPRISSIGVHSNRVHMKVAGEEGRAYVVQYSVDLESWMPISTNELPESGVIEFSGNIIESRFYRLLQMRNGAGTPEGISPPVGPVSALAANVPPVADITTPVHNSVFASPANILLSATVSDNDGTIRSVEFYEGWHLVGVDASSPYAVNWTNIMAGTYDISAIAIDDLGMRGTSAPVSITVVASHSPVGDAHVRGGRNSSANYGVVPLLEVQSANSAGNTMDSYFMFDLGGVSNVSRVILRINAALSRETTIETTAYATGTNWLEDSITWENRPALGASLDRVVVAATTNTWYELDVTGHVVSELASGRSVVSLALHNETNTKETILVNSREATANQPGLVLEMTNSLPSVLLTAPSDGAIFPPGSDVSITAIAQTPSGTVEGVEFYEGTTLLGVATAAPYSLTWSNASFGVHSLAARVVDSRGLTATSSVVNVIIDEAPMVTVTRPANGSEFAAPAVIELAASASDNDGSIDQVEFFEQATRLGVVEVAPYQWTWTDVAAGTHEITARATDELGVVSVSEPVTVLVHDPPRVLSPPENQIAVPGGEVMFGVIADGSSPLSYQWRLNGNELPGQTLPELVLTNLQASDFGSIDVVVTNRWGSVTSAAASLDQSVVAGWGDNSSGQTEIHPWMTNGIVTVDAGHEFNLALLSDGSVKGWGDNVFGQLDAPAGLTDAVAVSAGEWHSLALRKDGDVVGWGSDNFGAITPPVGLSNVVAIETGRSRSVALKNDGTVVAWGWDEFGQSTVPNGLNNVVAISSHGDHTLALCEDGTVVAWGWNEYGQTNVPSGLSNVVAIAAGAFNSMVMKSDGTFVGWGADPHGMLEVPADLANVSTISSGTSHSMALTETGTVVRWGGDPGRDADAPVPGGLTNVVAISAGKYHSIALRENGANLLPAVNITSPAESAILEVPVDITIAADASDWNGTISEVAFYADGRFLGSDTTAPYSVVWSNVVMGVHSLTARAVDDQGGAQDSSPIVIHVTASISTIADAHVRDGSYSSINFGTEPLLEVQTRTTGQNRESYFKFDLADVSIFTGARLRVFGALSGNGNVAATVHAVADINWIETEITWDTRPGIGGALDTTTVSGRTFGWYDLDVGSFVRAEKSAGRNTISLALRSVESSRRTFQIQSREAVSNRPLLILSNTNRPPSISIVLPANNDQFTIGDQVTIASIATDSDGVVEQVEFFANGISLGADTTEPFELLWANAGEGTHQLTAMATDDAGMSATSSAVTILVSAVPRVALISPTNNTACLEQAEIVLSASTSGFAGEVRKVEFFANSSLVAVATNSPFISTWSDVTAGGYSVFARATDDLGTTTDSTASMVTVFPEAFESVLPGRLGYWRFEDVNWWGEAGQLPVSFTNILHVSDGTHVALEVDSHEDAHLRYRDVEANHRPNFDAGEGSVVFAFSPNWSSVGNGGGGPGGPGQFLSVGQWTEDASIGCWKLSINADGTQLMFVTQSGGSGATNLIAPVRLSSNTWYQIALTYSSSNSTFYLDGTQIGTNGLGVTVYPDDLVRAQYGWSIGSDPAGQEQVRGRIDDLETFNYPLTAAEILVRPDTDSDGLPDGWELVHGLDLQLDEGDHGASGNPDGDALLNIEEWRLGSDPNSYDVPIGGNGSIQFHTPLEH